MPSKILYVLLWLVFVLGCKTKPVKEGTSNGSATATINSYQIWIQPYDEIEQTSIGFIQAGLNKVYRATIVVLPFKPLPQDAWYAERKRYWADTLLKHLKSLATAPNMYIVGITGKDISTKKSKYPNWGVMGLGFMPGPSCVVSDYRLQGYPKTRALIDSQLLKVTIHELGHNFGLPHCPTETCYMTDAEGKNKLDAQHDFCEKCTAFLSGKRVLR